LLKLSEEYRKSATISDGTPAGAGSNETAEGGGERGLPGPKGGAMVFSSRTDVVAGGGISVCGGMDGERSEHDRTLWRRGKRRDVTTVGRELVFGPMPGKQFSAR
jgi:hypothetical protein